MISVRLKGVLRICTSIIMPRRSASNLQKLVTTIVCWTMLATTQVYWVKAEMKVVDRLNSQRFRVNLTCQACTAEALLTTKFQNLTSYTESSNLSWSRSRMCIIDWCQRRQIVHRQTCFINKADHKLPIILSLEISCSRHQSSKTNLKVQ